MGDIKYNFKNSPVLIKCIECSKSIHFSMLNGICNKCLVKLFCPPKKIFRLYRASRAISNFINKLYIDIPIDEFVAYIEDMFHHYFNFQRMIIYAYKFDKEQLRGFCSSSVPEEYLHSLLLPTDKEPETDYLHRDVAVKSFREDRVITINDRCREPGYIKYLEELRAGEVPRKSYSRSFLAAPLKTKVGKVGVLELYRENGRYYKPITEEECQTIKVLSYQIASTIDIFFPQFYNKRFAIIDGLTELYNHKYFEERLKEELLVAERKGLSLSLLMIDIDNFKKFNDTYGHQVGDKVLKGVAQVIKNSTRHHDVTARYGGEEMAVILTDANFVSAKDVAERIRKGVENIENYKITVSIGIGCFSGILEMPNFEELTAHIKELNYEDLVSVADKNLYQAKTRGKNQVFP